MPERNASVPGAAGDFIVKKISDLPPAISVWGDVYLFIFTIVIHLFWISQGLISL